MRIPALAPSKAVRWLAVLAVAFQCIVVQSHVHGATGTAWRDQAAAAQPATDAIARRDQGSSRVPKDDDPANCFICQQMAIAGAALLPVSPAPILVAQELVTTTAAYHFAELRSVRSHAWRSRAPPLQI